MDKITLDTKLADIWDLPEMEPYYKYMLYTPHEIYKNSPFANGTVKDLGIIGWKPEGILAGLRFFLERIDGGRVEQYRIYPGTDDPYKRDVNLIQISPETPDADRPFIVLCGRRVQKRVHAGGIAAHRRPHGAGGLYGVPADLPGGCARGCSTGAGRYG